MPRARAPSWPCSGSRSNSANAGLADAMFEAVLAAIVVTAPAPALDGPPAVAVSFATIYPRAPRPQ